jgi:arginase family enzyme
MPLAMMAGLGEQRMTKAVGLTPVAAKNIILADGRDLDPGEHELVKSSGIGHIESFSELKIYPFEGPVYIHFDCDVVHLEDISAVKYPALGGPRASEVADVFKHLKATLDIVALSTTLGVWSDERGDKQKSEKIALDLLELLF